MIVKTKNLKKHEKIRILCIVMSATLYSTGSVPKKLNRIYLEWTERCVIPNDKEMKYLISKVDESYFRQEN